MRISVKKVGVKMILVLNMRFIDEHKYSNRKRIPRCLGQTGLLLSCVTGGFQMITKLLAGMLMLGGVSMAAEVSSAPTFNKDVLPILQKNCQVCHRPGQIAPIMMSPFFAVI